MAGATCRNCGVIENLYPNSGLCFVCQKSLAQPKQLLSGPPYPNPYCTKCGAPYPNAFSMLCYKCDPQTANAPTYALSTAYTGYPPYQTSFCVADPGPPKDLPTIKSTEPIVGYRVWNLNRKTMRLVSCWKKYEWPLRKRLERDDFDTMGIHAVKDTSRIVGAQPTMADPAGAAYTGLWREYSAEVAGSIWMWGEVKEAADGYLAQYAYPKQLWMPEETDPCVILELEENYGVPVELRAELTKTFIADGTVPKGGISYKFSFTALPASLTTLTSGSYTMFI